MFTERSTTRRSFYVKAIYSLWGIITALVAAPSAAYLLIPGRRETNEQWVEAGDISRLKAGVPEELVFRRQRKDGWKITSEKTSAWVRKISDKEAVAFAPQCPHLGCAYHWDEKHENFLCPCHTSTFSKDGAVLSGPAPRPLDRYESRVEGSKLHLGRIIQGEKAG